MAVSLDQFSKQLTDSGVMSGEDLNAFLGKLPAEAKPTDGEQLAKRLVREKKISAYQAQVVYSGKGKSLTMGGYFVLDKLGQGGMGMVLKAEHRMMKRLVAIKVLSPAVTKTKESQQRFQREVEAAARLTHPNIVAAFDAGESGGSPFLVMEYVPGDDLSSVVKKKGRLSVDQAIDCIAQAARGLEFAHKQGVIHRDIKPANLLLDTKGVVKILDMGLARIDASDVATQADLTGTGAVMGTVDYMAPEQAVSTKTADARSDLYSLGISLWYLLTAKSAYEGDSLMSRLLAHRDQPIPSLRSVREDVSESLDAVFHKLVAKKPTDRYQTATELMADLEACRTGASVKALVVAEVETGTDDFQDFLRQMESPTQGPRGSKSNPSLAGTKTQARSRPSITSMGETMARGNVSDTLPPGRRMKMGGKSKSPPWFQDIRVQIGGGAAAVLLLLAAIFLFQTPNGTLRVEILDPEVEVKVQGTTVTLKGADTEPVSLKAGNKKLLVTRGELSFETDSFTLKKGNETKVKVDLVDDNLIATSGGKVLGEKSVKRKALTTSTSGSDSKAVAASPNGSSGTGTKNAPAGKFALRFDGNGQTVEATGVPYRPTTVATIEAWLTCDAELKGTHVLIAQEPNGSLRISAPERAFSFYTFHGGPSVSQSVPSNRRIHLAGVNNGRQRLLFLDGKLIGKTDDAGVPHEDVISGREPPFKLKLRDDLRGTTDTARFSSVARYEQEFTPPTSFTPDKETVALYLFNEGQGDLLKDSSGNGYHGKINGAKWVTLDGSAIATTVATGAPIDLLAKVELPGDCVKRDRFGDWTREGQTLVSSPANTPGLVIVRYEPPPEYELTAVVERMTGTDGVIFGVNVDGHSAGVCFDMYGGPLSGISLIDGKHANENEAAVKQVVLADSKPHTIRILVGRRSVRGSVDDREIVRWEGDPRRLSPTEAFPNPKHLWFGAGYHQFKLHKLELRPVVNANNSAIGTPTVSPKPTIPAEALTFGGHRYLLAESFGTWVEAKAKAEAVGGHLATINSRAERDWILENVWRKRPNQDGGKMFLGGIHRGGSWSWVTDEPFDPSLWLGQIPTEPSLALAWASDTSWNHLPPDDPNARFAYFLVEWDTLVVMVGKNDVAAAGSVPPDASGKDNSFNNPAFQQWMKDVAAMPAEKQIKAVSKKLLELNPKFDGKLRAFDFNSTAPVIERGQVTSVGLSTINVSDVSPLRAFVELKVLDCHGGELTDLSPLTGMPLTKLAIHFTKVSDLSPLQGMKLEYLDCYDTPVSDLSPLRGAPLVHLDLRVTKVSDLSPLQQCQSLNKLGMNGTQVTATGIAALQKALPNCEINWDDPAKPK